MVENDEVKGAMKTPSALALISMLLLALSIVVILVAIAAPVSNSRLGNTAFLMLTALAVVMLVSSSFISTYAKKKAASAMVQKTISVIKCINCNHQEERDFQVGDFVFKRVGSCAKCQGALIVASIYMLSPRR